MFTHGVKMKYLIIMIAISYSLAFAEENETRQTENQPVAVEPVQKDQATLDKERLAAKRAAIAAHREKTGESSSGNIGSFVGGVAGVIFQAVTHK